MNTKKNIVADLEELFKKGLSKNLVPYKKGNSIRIGNVIIRKTSQSYKIIDCDENQLLGETYFLTSAIAIGKNYINGKDVRKIVYKYDKQMLKNSNDALFFRRMIKCTNDPFVKETREILLDIAVHNTNDARNCLNNLIY